MFFFPDDAETKNFKGSNDFLLWGIDRKFLHSSYTPASATKASMMGGSISKTSSPKVSI